MLNGIDIASHQSGLDAGKIAADFVIVKATGGTQYVNPLCDPFYQEAKKAGKLLGVYHYAHEAYCPGTAEQEAQHFLNNIQGYIGEAVLILDWESDNKHDVSWAKRFLDYVYEKTGVRALFYTYTVVVNAYDFSSIAKADYGLWIANYGANQIQGYSKPNPPASNGFGSTAMFQFTSSGRLPGWNANLDLNVFYGDKSAWQAYAKSNKQAKPEPVPTPTEKPAATVQTFKYPIGTVVTVGGVFLSSAQAATFNANNGYTPANKLTKNYGKITKQLKTNGVSTYLLDDGFGWINDGDVAKVGQSAPSVNTRTYTVRNGDTLSGISAKLGVPMATLQKNNNIANPNLIYAGQIIKY